MAPVGKATILIMGGIDATGDELADGMVINVEAAPYKERTIAAQNLNFSVRANSYCYT